ncbi:MAG: hypothetical protein B7Z60_08500 [Ferrovum sp. 37-45-19]|jgi:hypothetical protein|uniref:cytochrome oxidase putative small subunit CydP n=1 Tax=Ferrovum sp. JA12 TaxID=1356299 RepID=UPI000702C76F|nr:cytochrome oxidase putative small subunit CydP [Ferrovum sp. JA12]OYV78845.1 MAG: hypothetical protein B7Z65_08570 [Ferrovum sp. 21-44-67]OYV93504.1 MAG: hypothetical protein B7Z60_08500 [Ferrovum sp. 37-45-19]OZB33113.1 MAG: hypothetical protein B7X47_05115 [Ferrovum sp. 34-44-207]HQT82197.1 hypothetical protein [Ferrovaceae bacterium]KRH79930.1 hypothetical protein FERRO_10070 [Ferrovum sp. JA12]
MTNSNKPKLGKELTIVIVIKVLLLTLLWNFFVRHQEVHVDAAKVSQSFGLNTKVSNQSQGVNHDQ